MCNRTRNVGLFPDLMARDVRDGRLRPQVFAAEVDLDPSWVHRLIKGDAPLPASLLAPLVAHTGNRAYLGLVLDELGLQCLEANVANEAGEGDLQRLAIGLSAWAAPKVLRTISRWLDSPKKKSWTQLQRAIEALEQANRKIDTLLAIAKKIAAKTRLKAED